MTRLDLHGVTFPEGVSYSYGGGVQSTAMLVLAAQGYLPRGPFLFSNVGDDSEHPATMVYVREVAFEYAARHDIEIHELHRIPQKGPKKGKPETLYGRLMEPGSRSLPIPVRMPDTGAPGTRACTADFKIRVVARWLKEHGATPENPVQVGIGISTDEYQRANERRADQAFHTVGLWSDWQLATLRHDPASGTPECDALVACASAPEMTDHDLACAVVHDRMLSRRLRLEAGKAPEAMTCVGCRSRGWVCAKDHADRMPYSEAEAKVRQRKRLARIAQASAEALEFALTDEEYGDPVLLAAVDARRVVLASLARSAR